MVRCVMNKKCRAAPRARLCGRAGDGESALPRLLRFRLHSIHVDCCTSAYLRVKPGLTRLVQRIAPDFQSRINGGDALPDALGDRRAFLSAAARRRTCAVWPDMRPNSAHKMGVFSDPCRESRACIGVLAGTARIASGAVSRHLRRRRAVKLRDRRLARRPATGYYSRQWWRRKTCARLDAALTIKRRHHEMVLPLPACGAKLRDSARRYLCERCARRQPDRPLAGVLDDRLGRRRCRRTIPFAGRAKMVSADSRSAARRHGRRADARRVWRAQALSSRTTLAILRGRSRTARALVAPLSPANTDCPRSSWRRPAARRRAWPRSAPPPVSSRFSCRPWRRSPASSAAIRRRTDHGALERQLRSSLRTSRSTTRSEPVRCRAIPRTTR